MKLSYSTGSADGCVSETAVRLCTVCVGGLVCDRCGKSSDEGEKRDALHQMSLTTLNSLNQLKQRGG